MKKRRYLTNKTLILCVVIGSIGSFGVDSLRAEPMEDTLTVAQVSPPQPPGPATTPPPAMPQPSTTQLLPPPQSLPLPPGLATTPSPAPPPPSTTQPLLPPQPLPTSPASPAPLHPRHPFLHPQRQCPRPVLALRRLVQEDLSHSCLLLRQKCNPQPRPHPSLRPPLKLSPRFQLQVKSQPRAYPFLPPR